VNRDVVSVRRPEKATHPKVFYKGAHQATLDPLAARQPEGGLYLWSEQPRRTPRQVGAGVHPSANSSAAAVLAYDVSHTAPWDWRVSLYTWTKGIAAGVYLAALVLHAWNLFAVLTPLLAGVFLALTSLILIADLEHPFRFVLMARRPQWRSWLVKGAIIITLYGLGLAAQLVAGLLGVRSLPALIVAPTAALAVLTAAYTAFLFAQARARELWQSPLLPPHLVIQALMLGFAVYTLLGVHGAAQGLATTAALHLLLVLGEATLPHPTAHAALAAHQMTRGRFARFFWTGVGLSAASIAAPLLGPVGPAAAIAGLVAVLAHEHAFVQAGQSVPLA